MGSECTETSARSTEPISTVFPWPNRVLRARPFRYGARRLSETATFGRMRAVFTGWLLTIGVGLVYMLAVGLSGR